MEVKKKRAPRSSKLDPYIPKIQEILDRYEKATAQRIFEILQEEGYEGGISILRNRLRKLRPKPKRKPTIRFETEPGEQGQMDWSPYKLVLKCGTRLQVLCFSYVLGFSRRQFIDFTLQRDFFTLIRRHIAAFEHFGGVPEQCLYDSEKTVVLRWEANRPLYNPSFLQFITHYHCRPIACQRGRAQTKGKVEAPFKYIEGNLLNARTFHSLEDLRETASWWLANRSDTHIHDTTRRAPLELFMAEEAHMLQPLPSHHYDSSEIFFLVGRVDGFVELKTNFYSIPYENVGEILTVRVTDEEVFVYTPELKLVAHHERLPNSKAQKTELPEHRSGSKNVRYGLEPIRQTFCELGEAAESFLTGLIDKHPRNSGFHARKILLLKKSYHCDDIHKALVHAMRYHAYDCSAIERIVTARASPRTLEQVTRQRSLDHLRKLLPTVKQRALTEYHDLLEGSLANHSPEEDDNDSKQKDS